MDYRLDYYIYSSYSKSLVIILDILFYINIGNSSNSYFNTYYISKNYVLSFGVVNNTYFFGNSYRYNIFNNVFYNVIFSK